MSLVWAFLFVLAAPCLSLAQSVDTLIAGQGEIQSRFFVHETVPNPRIAIHLPPGLGGSRIETIRAYYVTDPATDPSLWQSLAEFRWSLADNDKWELISPNNIDLRGQPWIGGWLETQLGWVVPSWATDSLWLIGQWTDSARFVKLGRNSPSPGCELQMGYEDGGIDTWEGLAIGLMVELIVVHPEQGPPSGIVDTRSQQTSDQPSMDVSFAEGVLVVAVSGTDMPDRAFNVDVVNTLGQRIVSKEAAASGGTIQIPWSNTAASGVYFCRVTLGDRVWVRPVIHFR